MVRGWTVDGVVAAGGADARVMESNNCGAVESRIDRMYKQFHIHIDDFRISRAKKGIEMNNGEERVDVSSEFGFAMFVSRNR